MCLRSWMIPCLYAQCFVFILADSLVLIMHNASLIAYTNIAGRAIHQPTCGQHRLMKTAMAQDFLSCGLLHPGTGQP